MPELQEPSVERGTKEGALMFDGDLRRRIEALERAMDRVAPYVVSEPFSSRVFERWPVVNSLEELRLVIIEHAKALLALESKPDPHYVTLKIPGCGPEDVHVGTEIVALRERLEKLERVEGCRAGNELVSERLDLNGTDIDNLEQRVAGLERDTKEESGIRSSLADKFYELHDKLTLVEKAVIDQNDAAVHHLGEWQQRVGAIENGTAPGVQTTLADLSDRIQDLVQTAAQVSKYLHLLAALNGKKLGMSPYEPECQPVPILIDPKPIEKHKAR